MNLQAYILIQADPRLASEVTQAVREIPGVVACDFLAGPYDAVARVEAAGLDELGTTVVSRIQQVDGVTRTLSCPIVNR